ncbi:MAG: transcriptional regulator, partial [Hungatella sp.]
GIKVGEIDGELCLRIDKSVTNPGSILDNMLTSWNQKAKKLESGEITKEDYDTWRYKYPELDTSPHFAKVIPQGLSDMLVQAVKKIEKQEQKEARKKKK